jgi:CRP-like cAMP-binding protein
MSSVVLSGNLKFLSLGDVLQLIGSTGGTGVLRIISKYSSMPGVVYFTKGNIINASAPEKTGLDAVYMLFGWGEGDFEFSTESFNVPKVITTNRMEIILDGLRMVDDGEIAQLGPVSFEKKEISSLPVIRGPLIDYMYVADEEEFREGQTIIKENKHGNWVWSVMEGMVDIIKETPQGPLTLLRVGPGSFIGGVSAFMFQQSVRTATAIAASKVQLGVLDSQRLTEEFLGLSRDFKDFVISLDHRRKDLTNKAVEVYLRQDHLKERLANKKHTIRQGQKEDHLYRITQGEAAVVRKIPEGYVLLATLKEGDFIGHTPFLDTGHEPFSASVFTSEDFQASKVNKDGLSKEYDGLTPTLRNLIESIATTISVTTRVACEFQRKNAKETQKKQKK